jgi:hypothetical protein
MFRQVMSSLCSVFFSVSVDMICFLGGLVCIGMVWCDLVRPACLDWFDPV